MDDLKKILFENQGKIKNIHSKDELDSLKTILLGKNGKINQLFKKLSELENNEKKEFASQLNDLKVQITNSINKKYSEIELSTINQKLKNERIDITLPGREVLSGKIHPVAQVIDEISSIFSEIGFSIEEGPDVESEFNNFTAKLTY